MKLDELNALNDFVAAAEFRRCCGSKKWAETMTALRPFPNSKALFHLGHEVWQALSREDRLEAFAHHPRIGDGANLHARFGSSAQWASEEQKGTKSANEETLKELQVSNQEYEKRFGHVFLICATGKSASEMLLALRTRLYNSPEKEFEIASDEQAKITHLRLEKLLS